MRSIVFLLLVFSGQIFASELSKDKIVLSLKSDAVSLQDARKWYSVYHGAYLYTKEFDCEGSRDFGDVAAKMRKIRDKIMPSKGNTEFSKSTDISSYEEKEFTSENKSDFAEDMYTVCEALKTHMESIQ